MPASPLPPTLADVQSVLLLPGTSGLCTSAVHPASAPPCQQGAAQPLLPLYSSGALPPHPGLPDQLGASAKCGN